MIANYSIPIPPMDIQQEVVRQVQIGRAEAARLRAEAQRFRREAAAEVEALILGMTRVDLLVEHGEERMRVLAARRSLDWDELDDEERQRLVDDLLHEV
jgi:hypothetical protein